MRSTLAMTFAAALMLSVGSMSQGNPVQAQDKPVEQKPLWTVEEIRESWGKGASYHYALKSEGDGEGRAAIEVWNVSEKGFSTRSGMGEKGKFLKYEGTEERTWEKHFEGLADMVAGATTKQDKVATELMEFDCTLYTTVREEENGKWTMQLWLSKDLPGVFVKASRTGEMKDKVDKEEWLLTKIGTPQSERPWSDEKVAEAWKDGAKMVFSAAQGGEKATITLNILKADADGIKYTSTELVDGKERGPSEETNTWEEFFASVMPPRWDTTRTEEKLKTAAGEFDCVKYTHTTKDEDSSTSITTWAAKDKPGLLVKIVQGFSFGEESMEMVLELTEYKYGK